MLRVQLGELRYKQLYVVCEAFTFDTSVAHGRIIAAHEKPRGERVQERPDMMGASLTILTYPGGAQCANSTFTAALFLLAVVVSFGLQGNPPRAADAAKPATQKLEYRIVNGGLVTAGKTLSDLGEQGWEVCGVVPGTATESDKEVIFKRPKQ